LTVPFTIFGVLLLGTGVMRLVELAVSMRRMQARPGVVVDEPRLFPVMAALHIALVVAPLAEVALLQRSFLPALGVAAGAVFVAATLLRVWTLATIGAAWNVRVLLPHEDAIATTGPYRFIRHPNYLVVILEIAALPLFHGAWVSAAGLSATNAMVLYHRIRIEEATLARSAAWRMAMQDRKRLIPWVF
jgi:methyltransferase